MRFWVKVVLFLSAYLPLFLIMAIKYYTNIVAVALFGIILLLSAVSWVAMILITRKNTHETFKVLSAENRAKDALNYLIPYVVSFIAFNFGTIPDLAAFGVLMMVIFIIYLESGLVYINPLLSLFERHIFAVQAYRPSTGSHDAPEELLILTTKRNFRKGETIHVKRIDEDFAMVD